MSDNKMLLKNFVQNCTTTFRAFDYSVEVSKSQATIWHFVAVNPSREKSYAVYCAPEFNKSKSLVKVALKKLKGMRLVVVTENHTEQELEQSREDGYALLTEEVLQKYGEEMIEIRAREAELSNETLSY